MTLVLNIRPADLSLDEGEVEVTFPNCAGMASGTVSVTIRQNDGEGRFLGPSGWQIAEFRWTSDRVRKIGADLIVPLGRLVSDKVEDFTPLRIDLPDHNIQGIGVFGYIPAASVDGKSDLSSVVPSQSSFPKPQVKKEISDKYKKSIVEPNDAPSKIPAFTSTTSSSPRPSPSKTINITPPPLPKQPMTMTATPPTLPSRVRGGAMTPPLRQGEQQGAKIGSNSYNGSLLTGLNELLIKQRHELGEWFGFETRNRYEIQTIDGHSLAFAAEQDKSFLGLLFRQIWGHWRSFDIRFFTPDRREIMTARHPFRWYFRELVVTDHSGRLIGRIVKRFAILSKSFELRNAHGSVLFEVSSPIWKLWTFPFVRQGVPAAAVRKKWSGVFLEALTDKDNFLVQFDDPSLNQDERLIILASAIFIDLLYFEKKAQW